MNWFKDIKTRIELKSKFHELAKIHHPDYGGDTRVMADIICQYQRLAKILPDIKPESVKDDAASHAQNAPAVKTRPLFCSYRPATASGANPHLARLATPVYSHKEICLMAKSLFVYGHLSNTEDLRELYRRLCRIIDPGQWKPYCDYCFNRKIALQSLELMKKKVLNSFFSVELWNIFKTARDNLKKAA